MKVIGFNFTKMSADKPADAKGGFIVNNHIEFIDVEKEQLDIVKDFEPVKIKFRFLVSYDSQDVKEKEKKKEFKSDIGSIIFEGIIMLALSKDQAKDILKEWKKKELSNELKIPLFNIILKKCTPKALDLEDQLGLPFHVPLPRISPQKQE